MKLKRTTYLFIIPAVFSLISCMPKNVDSPKTQGPVVPSQTETYTPGTKSLLGTVDGGGGRVVVCKDKVQVLDLYEAQKVLNLTLIENKGTTQKQWSAFTKRYANSLQENIDDGIDYSKVKTISDLEQLIGTAGHRVVEKATPKGETLRALFDFEAEFTARASYVEDLKLRKIDDSHETFEVPQNCSIEQIINYRPDDTILIQKHLWEKLDEQNRAALMAHEYVYREYRVMGATTSVQTRKIIGQLFSNETNTEPDFDSGGIKCTDSNRKVYGNISVFPAARGRDESTISFSNYPDQLLIAPTAANFSAFMLFKHIESLKSCLAGSNEDSVKIEDRSDSKLEVTTSYFHDTFNLKYSITCPAHAPKGATEFRVILENAKSKEQLSYKCWSFDSIE